MLNGNFVSLMLNDRCLYFTIFQVETSSVLSVSCLICPCHRSDALIAAIQFTPRLFGVQAA
jgi:hypothetical protein